MGGWVDVFGIFWLVRSKHIHCLSMCAKLEEQRQSPRMIGKRFRFCADICET